MRRERWIRINPQLKFCCTWYEDCNEFAAHVEIEEEEPNAAGIFDHAWDIVGILNAYCDHHRAQRI
jgi:hypothetical protein